MGCKYEGERVGNSVKTRLEFCSVPSSHIRRQVDLPGVKIRMR